MLRKPVLRTLPCFVDGTGLTDAHISSSYFSKPLPLTCVTELSCTHCRLHFAEERLRCFLQLQKGNTSSTTGSETGSRTGSKAKKRRLQEAGCPVIASVNMAGQGRHDHSTGVLQAELQHLTADRAMLIAKIEVSR